MASPGVMSITSAVETRIQVVSPVSIFPAGADADDPGTTSWAMTASGVRTASESSRTAKILKNRLSFIERYPPFIFANRSDYVFKEHAPIIRTAKRAGYHA